MWNICGYMKVLTVVVLCCESMLIALKRQVSSFLLGYFQNNHSSICIFVFISLILKQGKNNIYWKCTKNKKIWETIYHFLCKNVKLCGLCISIAKLEIFLSRDKQWISRMLFGALWNTSSISLFSTISSEQ